MLTSKPLHLGRLVDRVPDLSSISSIGTATARLRAEGGPRTARFAGVAGEEPRQAVRHVRSLGEFSARQRAWRQWASMTSGTARRTKVAAACTLRPFVLGDQAWIAGRERALVAVQRRRQLDQRGALRRQEASRCRHRRPVTRRRLVRATPPFQVFTRPASPVELRSRAPPLIGDCSIRARASRSIETSSSRSCVASSSDSASVSCRYSSSDSGIGSSYQAHNSTRVGTGACPTRLSR